MIRARFSPKAGRDLDEHCGHIAADNPEAAERVRRTILNTADFLAQHRELGRRIRNSACLRISASHPRNDSSTVTAVTAASPPDWSSRRNNLKPAVVRKMSSLA